MPKPVSAITPRASTALPPVAKPPAANMQDKFIELVKSKKARQSVNNWSSWIAAGLNLLTFATANFRILDRFQSALEKIAGWATKASYIAGGVAGTIDLAKKKNPVSFLGFASGIPLTILSSNYNLYLAYGIPYGLGNFVIITDQREVVDKNGEPIPDKDGNVQLVNGDFSKRGWLKGLTTTFAESGKIIKELIQKPQRIKKMSHALFTSSTFEMFGPIFGYLGLVKLGSFIRSTGTIASQAAFLLHNDSSKKSSVKDHGKVTLKSAISIGGILGIAGSAIDFIKRIGFISDKIPNLTNLSLALDRGMGALIVSGIMDIENQQQEPQDSNKENAINSAGKNDDGDNRP